MNADPGPPPAPSSAPTTSELADRVHSLAIHLLRRVRGVDSRSGLSAARLSALSVLVYGGPRTVGQLAGAEQVTAATMSRLVTGLEREGLVDRESDPVDGRRVRVVATSRGRRLLAAARSARVEAMAALLRGLTPDQRSVVAGSVELLESLLEGAPQ
jgi:DNA-binding MarR family transcriptional regulator